MQDDISHLGEWDGKVIKPITQNREIFPVEILKS